MTPQSLKSTGLRSGLFSGQRSGPMNWGVARGRKSIVSRARWAVALSLVERQTYLRQCGRYLGAVALRVTRRSSRYRWLWRLDPRTPDSSIPALTPQPTPSATSWTLDVCEEVAQQEFAFLHCRWDVDTIVLQVGWSHHTKDLPICEDWRIWNPQQKRRKDAEVSALESGVMCSLLRLVAVRVVSSGILTWDPDEQCGTPTNDGCLFPLLFDEWIYEFSVQLPGSKPTR